MEIGRFCVYYRVCVLQVWGSADFVFNIGCVCYGCGDRQIFLTSTGKQKTGKHKKDNYI